MLEHRSAPDQKPLAIGKFLLPTSQGAPLRNLLVICDFSLGNCHLFPNARRDMSVKSVKYPRLLGGYFVLALIAMLGWLVFLGWLVWRVVSLAFT
jgi:hypothetical protein